MISGRYRATRPFTLKLMLASEFGGDAFDVESRRVDAGEEFEIPETVNGYFYYGGTTAEESRELFAEFGPPLGTPNDLDFRPNVVRL